MSQWRHWSYPLPADDSLEVLWEVMDRIPEVFSTELDWTLTDTLMVAVDDVTAAVYIRLAFDGSRLSGTDGPPVLEPNEVLISVADHAKCEAMLRENCRAAATWFSVIVVSSQTEEAWQAFDDAYRAVVGDLTTLVQPKLPSATQIPEIFCAATVGYRMSVT